MSTEQERAEALAYLKKLTSDRLFKKYVVKPLEAQADAFAHTLQDLSETHEVLRQSQGALEAMRFVLSLLDEERYKDKEHGPGTTRPDAEKRQRRATSVHDYLAIHKRGGSSRA